MNNKKEQIDLLKNIIKETSKESPVRPGDISSEDARWKFYPLRAVARLLRKTLKKNTEHLNDFNDPYIFSKEGKPVLKPITRIERYTDKKELVHLGSLPIKVLLSGKIDLSPIEEMRSTGVFGYSKTTKPTYLMPKDKNIIPGMSTRELLLKEDGPHVLVKIYVDVIKLGQVRDIYHDPEMFLPDPDFPNEVPGSAFMVFGGIPLSCIRVED